MDTQIAAQRTLAFFSDLPEDIEGVRTSDYLVSSSSRLNIFREEYPDDSLIINDPRQYYTRARGFIIQLDIVPPFRDYTESLIEAIMFTKLFSSRNYIEGQEGELINAIREKIREWSYMIERVESFV